MFVPIFRLAKYFVKPVDRRKSTSLYKLALCYKYFSGLQLRFNSSIYIYIRSKIYLASSLVACLPCFWWLHSNPSQPFVLGKTETFATTALDAIFWKHWEAAGRDTGGQTSAVWMTEVWPKYDRSEPTTLWCLQLSWHCGAVVSLKLSNQPWNIVKL